MPPAVSTAAGVGLGASPGNESCGCCSRPVYRIVAPAEYGGWDGRAQQPVARLRGAPESAGGDGGTARIGRISAISTAVTRRSRAEPVARLHGAPEPAGGGGERLGSAGLRRFRPLLRHVLGPKPVVKLLRRAGTGRRWRGNSSDRPDFGDFDRRTTRSGAEYGPGRRQRNFYDGCQTAITQWRFVSRVASERRRSTRVSPYRFRKQTPAITRSCGLPRGKICDCARVN